MQGTVDHFHTGVSQCAQLISGAFEHFLFLDRNIMVCIVHRLKCRTLSANFNMECSNTPEINCTYMHAYIDTYLCIFISTYSWHV